jgi:NACHT domain- and WD repeat-containing protein
MAQAARIFRVFVSSTFGDLKVERDALHKYVWPALRELCMRHGTRFQAIDLRWGISYEAAIDQRTLPICLEELRRCQQVSPRPNFVVLLGDRYGWQPLPYKIPAVEFESLVEIMPPEERARLEWSETGGWYRRDDNANPPEYVLLGRTGEFQHHDRWEREERELLAILQRAVNQSGLHPDAALKYGASATEQEIHAGALKTGASTDHVFVFVRRIEGLPLDEVSADYVDRLPDGQADVTRRRRLAALKAALEARLPSDNVKKDYVATWTPGVLPPISTGHIDRLCLDVFTSLAQVILDEVGNVGSSDDLDLEMGAHARFQAERSRVVIGRQTTLDSLTAYLSGTADQLCLVHGPPGCGKSAVMALAASEAERASPRGVVIRRFIGATPNSSDARSLLNGVCREIARACALEEDTPNDLPSLVDVLKTRLASATRERPIIVIVDGLDQLTTSDGARSLDWLPTRLPPFVRVVVSAVSGPDGSPSECYDALIRRIAKTNCVELALLQRTDGEEALRLWFDEPNVRRRLQPHQLATLLDAFTGTGLGLHLRLLFEEGRGWRSFDVRPVASTTVARAISDLFAGLSKPERHSSILVERALAYLAAAKDGLAEEELLDVLSGDADVMNSYMATSYHELSEPRLPVAVWARLHFDLRPYLLERSADGAVLIGFFHQQILAAVDAQYLAGGDRPVRHEGLARYFQAQPLEANIGTSPTDAVSARILEAVESLRDLATLPSQSRLRPNLRKLAEQPYQQAMARTWSPLVTTLTDFSFLERKAAVGQQRVGVPARYVDEPTLVPGRVLTKRRPGTLPSTTGVFDLLEDYRRARRESESSSASGMSSSEQAMLSSFERALSQEAYVLASAPHLLCQQIFNRLSGNSDAAERCLQQIDARMALGVGLWFRARIRPLDPISFLRVLRDPGLVKTFAFSPDGKHLVSGNFQGTLRLWDVSTGAELALFEGHSGEIRRCVFSPDAAFVLSCSTDGTLRLWNVATRAPYATLRGHGDGVEDCAFSPDGQSVLSASRDATLKLWDASTGTLRHTLAGHTNWVRACAFSPNGQWAVSAALYDSVKLWDVASGREKATLASSTRRAEVCAFSPDNRWVMAPSWDNTLTIWAVGNGQKRTSLNGHTDVIYACAFSPDGRTVASAADDGTVCVWDGESGRLTATLWHDAPMVRTCAFSPDGTRLVSAAWDKTVRVWDMNTLTERSVFRGHSGIQIAACGFSPDGHLVASTSDTEVRVWEATTDAVGSPIAGHSDVVATCSFSRDGATLVTGSHDKTIKIWDVTTGRELGTFSGHQKHVKECALAPDGKLLVSAALDGMVKLWDVVTRRELSTLFHDRDWGRMRMFAREVCRFSPDGRSIWATAMGTLRQWDAASTALHRTLAGIGVLRAFSASGETAIASGDGALTLWDLIEGRVRVELVGHSDSVEACAFSPNGRLVVSAARDKTLKVWDAASGNHRATLTGHVLPVTCCGFSPDGHSIVSGSEDFVLKLWSVEDRRERVSLIGHNGCVTSCSFTPDGQFVVSTAEDSMLKIWDVATGLEVGSLPAPGLNTIALHPFQPVVAYGASSGQTWIGDVVGLS